MQLAVIVVPSPEFSQSSTWAIQIGAADHSGTGNFPRRLSRQMIKRFDAITTTAPASTDGKGHSFQIIQPNSVD